MKQAAAFFLALWLLTMPAYAITPLTDNAIPIDAPAACLLEQSTGTVLYEKDAHSRRHIASVTKVMTLLLVMEAIESGAITWDTEVVASANAASMGGSQIWLEQGERMTVKEMVKCITVVSANDCSVAMAEQLSGSETAFAARMNDRAAALGLKNTHFTNCTGLFDDPDHYSSAYDVAVMARELMTHDAIREFTTIWTDTARNGEFGLSNTNKLIRYYDGATGLKTGFTNGAMYCLAATAQRDGTAYVAVVLGADSSDHRFESAKTLLSHGFASYSLCDVAQAVPLPRVRVTLGQSEYVIPVCGEGSRLLLEKEQAGLLRYVPTLPERVAAPVAEGQQLGTIGVYSGNTLLAEVPVVAQTSADAMTVWQIAKMLLRFDWA